MPQQPRQRETLISFIEDCATRGDEIAIVHLRGLRLHRWTYARLAFTARCFALELEQRAIGKGERVLLYGENSPEWVAAFFGCLLRGVIAVPLDKLSAPDFISRVQGQVSARLMLADSDLTERINIGIDTLPLDQLGDLVAHCSPVSGMESPVVADDLVEIIFTSGTTAEPRGVCITHRNFLANLQPLEGKIVSYHRWERLAHPVRLLSLLPLGHVFGQFMGIFVPLLLGGEVHFQESLKPSAIIDVVRARRITVITAFPRLLESLKQKIERDIDGEGGHARFLRAFEAASGRGFLRRALMFSRIHSRFGWKFWAFVSGGASLDRRTEEFWRRLGYAVIQGYGMTETASIISMPHPFEPVSGSIGKVLAGQEVKVNPDGEILIRGDNVAAGYWSPGGGVRQLRGEEGWLHTGDIGEFDSQGNLFFRGREKDIIATASGMKVYPEDLEAALAEQPEVKATCVIGVEGVVGPEAMAVLILDPSTANPAEIVARANQRLASHQRIRRWAIWPQSDFPRTLTTGKVIKRYVVRAIEQQKRGEPGDVPGESPQPSSAILQEVARIAGDATMESGTDASLSGDLKLDSLGRVELLSALEDRFQIELDEASFTSAATLGDVERMIREGAPETIPYPFPVWPNSRIVSWVRTVVYHLILLPLTKIMCWVGVVGRENVSDQGGPVLFVSNHVTMLDAALILSALPMHQRRLLAIAMLGEYLREWRNPPPETGFLKRIVLRVKYTLVVALFNVFPLPQQSGFRRSFAYAGEMVDRGLSVLVFPEGQRTKDGQVKPFMAGTGQLVQNLGVPVIPVKIDGLFELAKMGRRFTRPGAVTVKFGKALAFNRETKPAEVTHMLESAVAAM